jgi:hypothetical protein
VLLRILKLDHPIAEQRNRNFHKLLLTGIDVSWRESDQVRHDTIRLVDFANVDANEFLVVNQFASVRSKMRPLIKRLLRKYKYSPEGQEEAVTRVLEQAEALAAEWA